MIKCENSFNGTIFPKSFLKKNCTKKDEIQTVYM